jgi:hypothetical protein
MNTDEIIQTRRSTHGPFAQQFAFAQMLKLIFRKSPQYKNLTGVQRETLDMAATKLSRILIGDPHVPDHWDDLAGYSRLAAMELLGISDQAEMKTDDETQQAPMPDREISDESVHAAVDPDASEEASAPVAHPHIYDAPIGPQRPLRPIPPAPGATYGVPTKEQLGVNIPRIDMNELEREVEEELQRAH